MGRVPPGRGRWIGETCLACVPVVAKPEWNMLGKALGMPRVDAGSILLSGAKQRKFIKDGFKIVTSSPPVCPGTTPGCFIRKDREWVCLGFAIAISNRFVELGFLMKPVALWNSWVAVEHCREFEYGMSSTYIDQKVYDPVHCESLWEIPKQRKTEKDYWTNNRLTF